MAHIGWPGKDRTIVEEKEKAARGPYRQGTERKMEKRERREGVIIKALHLGIIISLSPLKATLFLQVSLGLVTASWAEISQGKKKTCCNMSEQLGLLPRGMGCYPLLRPGGSARLKTMGPMSVQPSRLPPCTLLT